jgi:hypothetical protein
MQTNSLVRFALVALLSLVPLAARSEPVAVLHREGVVHGFLALGTTDGKKLADGDLIQTTNGSAVTSRLVFRFFDGSLQDETVVFTQQGAFRFVSDHLVQKGPAFPQPMDVSIDGKSGVVTVRYAEGGEDKVIEEHMDLPADLSNGMILTLLKNIRPDAPLTTVSMVVAAPKPRLVKLAISPSGASPFSLGRASRKAIRYVVKIELGGVAGVVAPLVGKQPPDSYVWILPGKAPAFVRSENPLYNGGPPLRIDLTSPVWPREPTSEGPVLTR